MQKTANKLSLPFPAARTGTAAVVATCGQSDDAFHLFGRLRLLLPGPATPLRAIASGEHEDLFRAHFPEVRGRRRPSYLFNTAGPATLKWQGNATFLLLSLFTQGLYHHCRPERSEKKKERRRKRRTERKKKTRAAALHRNLVVTHATHGFGAPTGFVDALAVSNTQRGLAS